MKKLGLMLFSLAWIGTSFSQTLQDKEKVAKVRKMKLTYHHFGIYCPPHADKAKDYGFRIKCIGCMPRRRTSQHNDKVVKKLNEVYGESWFENNSRFFFN